MCAFIQQETDTGPITGGVGAVATAGPAATYGARNSGTRIVTSGISGFIIVGLALSLT